VFAQLIETFKNPIFSQMLRWVGQRELAEEMAQDVFLKAYRNIGKFRKDAKFSTWLFQIALNRARDYWREGKSRAVSQALLREETLEAKPSPSAEEEIQSKNEAERLRTALNQLKADYRETLSLRFLSDLSLQEVAELTGEGLSNTKMRVLRGLTQLRKIMGQSREASHG